MASREASFILTCCTAANACGPARRMSPMWLTSKIPTPVRTAICSATRPPVAGYSTGISHPLKATIFAPIFRWTAFNAVLRIAGALSTTDKKDLDQVYGLDYEVRTYQRITRIFARSTEA